jgi:cleavage stimulation factor subunit 3
MTRVRAFSGSCIVLTSTFVAFVDARALFERVIPTFSPERARPLWERWARYEYQYGDLEAAQKLEKRIADVYPNGTSTSDLLHDSLEPFPPI